MRVWESPSWPGPRPLACLWQGSAPATSPFSLETSNRQELGVTPLPCHDSQSISQLNSIRNYQIHAITSWHLNHCTVQAGPRVDTGFTCVPAAVARGWQRCLPQQPMSLPLCFISQVAVAWVGTWAAWRPPNRSTTPDPEAPHPLEWCPASPVLDITVWTVISPDVEGNDRICYYSTNFPTPMPFLNSVLEFILSLFRVYHSPHIVSCRQNILRPGSLISDRLSPCNLRSIHV